MKTIQFNTTIKCSGCVANVKDALNEVVGEGNWEVDLQAPSRTLTVRTAKDANEVEQAVKQAGFKAEKV